MSQTRFDGINASVPLPLTADGRPDLDAFRRYLEWLRPRGIIGVTVNADTGEGALLDLDERLAVVRAAREALPSEIAVVSGLIASHTGHAVELARSLTDAGADALLVFSPSAFIGSPLPDSLVLGYFEQIAGVGTPLIAFNLSAELGGTVLSPNVLCRLADEGFIAALKEASFDPVTYIASRDGIRSSQAQVAFLTGCDNFIYESLVLGADGCLLGFCAVAADLTARLFDLVCGHRIGEAEKLNRESIAPLAAALYAPPMRDSRARIKAGLMRLGAFDNAIVRPPLLAVSDEEIAAIFRAIEAAGLV